MLELGDGRLGTTVTQREEPERAPDPEDDRTEPVPRRDLEPLGTVPGGGIAAAEAGFHPGERMERVAQEGQVAGTPSEADRLLGVGQGRRPVGGAVVQLGPHREGQDEGADGSPLAGLRDQLRTTRAAEAAREALAAALIGGELE